MKPFSYVDNEVTPARLEELRHEFETAKADQKYNRYRAWLHYANLDRWRNQGHHFFYLTMHSAGAEKLVCTCGLVVLQNDIPLVPRISDEIMRLLTWIELDPIQAIKGHRDFKTKDPVSAIIVKYFVNGEDSYSWSCICQLCGAHEQKISNKRANEFCISHNRSHMI